MMDESASTAAVIAGTAPSDGRSTDPGSGNRFCQACGAQIEAGAAFCGECGHALTEGLAAEAPTAEHAAPTGDPYTWHAQAQAAVGGAAPQPPPPMGGPPPYMLPYPYSGAPAPTESGHNTGLIIGLIAAAIAAIAAIAAVILLASAGGGSGPSITTPASAPAIAAPPATAGASDSSAAGGGSGASLAVTPKRHSSPTKSAPSAPAAQASSGADIAAASATVERHWTLIGQGDYQGAFDLFAPGYQSSLGRDSWIADKNRDRPTVSSLVVGSAQITSSTSATVPLVSLHTVGQESPPCHDWTGSYDLTKVNGAWLITQANLSPTTC